MDPASAAPEAGSAGIPAAPRTPASSLPFAGRSQIAAPPPAGSSPLHTPLAAPARTVPRLSSLRPLPILAEDLLLPDFCSGPAGLSGRSMRDYLSGALTRAIHRTSLRAEKPLIAVNCAAFTETLLESELFGNERGAFTGADRAREGVFEAANEGTLFLDEAAEMSLAAQAKLLRVLTDGLVPRLGSSKPRHTDVRLLVATNRDLKRRVQEGRFREDLYYRLAVVPLTVPALRDHREDIPELCALFLVQAVRDLNTPPRRISAEALRTLLSYDFPGNIRELRNLIERACILSTEEEITPENFPVSTPRSANGVAPDRKST